MKSTTIIFCIILCHLRVFSQNIEVAGGIIVDSIDVSSGLIRNVANPIAAQDAATKAYVDLLEKKIEALEGVKDIDNNRYDIISIGTQTWMAENLKTTRYNDGTVIPLVTDSTAWTVVRTNGDPGYCWYENVASHLIAYGARYNWHAIDRNSNDDKNVCPTGWHVPTDIEWTTLTNYLGFPGVAGGKMKEAGLSHWISPNSQATNESGFAGLPGGYRDFEGIFWGIGINGIFWSSSAFDVQYGMARNLIYSSDDVGVLTIHKGSGLAVRCLRD